MSFRCLRCLLVRKGCWILATNYDQKWKLNWQKQNQVLPASEKRVESNVKPMEERDLNRFLRNEGMDLLVYFPRKEEAYICNFRGEIQFKMKTNPNELLKEVQRRNRE